MDVHGRRLKFPADTQAVDGRFIAVKSVSLPNSTLPVSGLVRPVMMSIIVLLPAPFGPMMVRNSPSFM
jgi:hypothetical protein